MTQEHIISPEWLVADRADVVLDEAVQGGWTIQSAPLMRGASFTDFASHQIAVPTGDSEKERAVRLHELIHARISPTRVPAQLLNQLGINPASMRLAEEVRVNLVGRYVQEGTKGESGRISELSDGSEAELAKAVVERDDWKSALSLYMTTLNTDIHKTVKRRLRKNPEWKNAFTVIDKYMSAEHLDLESYNTWRSVRARTRSTDPVNYTWIDDRTRQADETFLGDGFINYTLTLAQKIDQWLATPPTAKRKSKEVFFEEQEAKKGEGILQSSDWESLRFGITSLTEPTGSFIGKRKRPAMTGKYPSRPDRLLTDPERRIFRETVRGAGGVVVFDCSGSMGVDHEHIYNCAKQFQGATIVCYSNTETNRANTWVVARNGRMISEDDFRELPLNSGNGVDGPVLRWALRQKNTSKDFVLWVSDGAVTGKNDCRSNELDMEVAQLSVRHNIIGAETPDKAVELLQTMKRTGSMPRHSFCNQVQATIKYHLNK